MKSCWKKVSDTKYTNKKRSGTLLIFPGFVNSSVNIEIDRVKIGRVALPQTHIHEEFKKESQANSFAKKYMKENC